MASSQSEASLGTAKKIGISRPVVSFGLSAILLLPFCVGATRFVYPASGGYGPSIAATVFILGSLIVLWGLRKNYPHGKLGLCNVITHIRFGFVALLSVGIFFTPTTPDEQWALVAIAIIALSLDGFDGWAARRGDLTSEFGARFDMEVDAFLAAILSLIVLNTGIIGPIVLCLGFTRYAFILAGFALPWLNEPLMPSMRRKTICVVQIAVLIALIAPILPNTTATIIAVSASALLLASFATDIFWLSRHRVTP